MRWPLARKQPSAIDRSDWIADAAWDALLDEHAFLGPLGDSHRARLRAICGAFLASKAINGAQGLVVDDAIVARIVVQACLPILELGLGAYPAFEEIVVYPNDFVIDREVVDGDGVVHAGASRRPVKRGATGR